MLIGEKIRNARKNKKLTQRQLAERIGKGYSTVQKYEIGVIEPPIQILKKIATVLELPLEFFFSEEDIKKATEQAKEYGERVEIIRDLTLDDALTTEQFNMRMRAIEESDRIYLENVKEISDGRLKRELLDTFKYLNRRGKFEALDILERMVDDDRFSIYWDKTKKP